MPALLHDDRCPVCRQGRAAARAARWSRLRARVGPWLVVVTLVAALGLAEGILGGGPR